MTTRGTRTETLSSLAPKLWVSLGAFSKGVASASCASVLIGGHVFRICTSKFSQMCHRVIVSSHARPASRGSSFDQMLKSQRRLVFDTVLHSQESTLEPVGWRLSPMFREDAPRLANRRQIIDGLEETAAGNRPTSKNLASPSDDTIQGSPMTSPISRWHLSVALHAGVEGCGESTLDVVFAPSKSALDAHTGQSVRRETRLQAIAT